jgi:hypothetical protein
MTPLPITAWFDLPDITRVLTPQTVHALFTGLPEAHLVDLSPLFIQIDLGDSLQRCDAAMLEATRIGLIADSQRQAFALEQLRKEDRYEG